MLEPVISLNSIVMVSSNQVFADLGGEVAILNLSDGVYYGLDPVGSRIWELIQQPKIVNDICDTLLVEYEVEPERCEYDLLALLEDLAAHNLIKVTYATDT